MREIVLHKTFATVPNLALAATSLPDWVGPLLVTVLGLALLAFYVKGLLFTPVEEVVLVPESRSLREPPAPERYRLRRLRVLRFLRPR